MLGSTPLISTLSVANATTALNSTRVICTDIGESRADSSTSAATMHVIPKDTAGKY